MAEEAGTTTNTNATDGVTAPNPGSQAGESSTTTVAAVQPEMVVPPLFGETVTEAELRGEVPDPPPENAETKTETAKVEGEAGKGGLEVDTEAGKTETEKPKVDGPTVPLAALHEERGKRQALSSENAELRRRLAEREQAQTVQTPQSLNERAKVPADFKLLSDDEYRDLLEEDLASAGMYKRYEDRYLRAVDEVKAEKSAGARADQNVSAMVQARFQDMEAAVPGIFDESNPINEQLTEFGIAQGLDADYFPLLLNPSTRLLAPDGTKVILGKGAVGLLKFLNNAFKAAKPEALDPETAERLRAEGAKEVLDKFTNSDGTQTRRSIGDLPPGGKSSVPLDVTQPFSEKQFGALTSEQQERILRGETVA